MSAFMCISSLTYNFALQIGKSTYFVYFFVFRSETIFLRSNGRTCSVKIKTLYPSCTSIACNSKYRNIYIDEAVAKTDCHVNQKLYGT